MSTQSNVKNVRCALSLNAIPEITQCLNSTLDMKYTYMVCPLLHPRFKREYIKKNLRHQRLPLSRTDLILNADSWQNYIVATASKFYNCDSNCEFIRKNSANALIEELKFVAHLNLSNYIIPLRSGRVENLAHILNNFLLNKFSMFNILLSVPLCLGQSDQLVENAKEVVDENSWYWWRKIRTLCEENSKLGVVLQLTPDLPSSEEIERWLSEPVKAVVIPTSLFLTNKSGFPVLSKAHQIFINQILKLDVDFIIEGVNRHEEKGMGKYYEYMNFLFKQYQQNNTELGYKFTKGYEDCLQNPLQPLMDNLESQVYEIFEKDPIKYQQYQRAIAQALLDRVSDSEVHTKESVIMVVGAGRGPLVKAALQASYDTQRKVKLYAVEKNPNAVNTLLNLKNDEWGDKVEIIASDMRDWRPTEKADILVSELLGSVGDNELSPECLDGAQSFLKDDGISIPYRYRSFIAPVQSYKIYSEVKKCREYEHPFEAPYVVLLNNHCRIDEEKFLFEFTHPNRSVPIDNNRYAEVEFKAKYDATIHGIGGYFDSHLYKNIDISITPKTHSSGLFSWFPMFFPLKNPIDVKCGDIIKVSFWRIVTNKQVHYEWCLTSPTITPIHNPNGRTYWIGLV